MENQSYLENKYFIDSKRYNCPFCNVRSVAYELKDAESCDWSENLECYIYFVECSNCKKTSIHLSYEKIHRGNPGSMEYPLQGFDEEIDDIDSKIFYSHPTSFFTLDSRIPSTIRELIAEGAGCLKMNFLTGASACIRKAIYEFLINEDAEGDDYESKIKSLKTEYPTVSPELFDTLAQIQGMTSNKVHEQSWDSWDSAHIKLFIKTLKTVLYKVYVSPEIDSEMMKEIEELKRKAEEE